ncbi:hypothetical protein BT96DRAFT_1020453 [Gymnopus androsaceus JB14]|uniref:DUF6534 domain-containing protein n=1 Tax=Gymnopus androsaceus JB14 TaxID=1447944 RepID=A0A6A4HIW2_9AGAR|nr:hypothetical protein BT96DRAFT_1020453 [Gymnopus androsaceus JB14]
MTTTVLVPTMGALLIGVLISCALYGVTTFQTYLYFQQFATSDSRFLKYTVVFLWLLETVHTALAAAFVFRLQILDFGNFDEILVTHVSDDVTHGILACIIFLVHCFYIRRLWLFTHNIYVTGLVMVLALCHFGFEMVVMALIFIFPNFSQFHKTTPYFTTAMVMAVSADIIIAATMTIELRTKMAMDRKTNTLLSRLSAYVISTGVLTSAVDIIILSTFIAMPDNLVYLCFLNFVNNFYANSMIARLNARQSLRSTRGGVHTDTDVHSMNDLSSRPTRSVPVILRRDDKFSSDQDDGVEISKTVERHVV